MKRIITNTPVILLILYSILPALCLIGSALGYDFELYYDITFTFIQAVISIALLVALSMDKPDLNSANAMAALFLVPVAVINGILHIFSDAARHSLVMSLICVICASIILYRYASPRWARIASGVVSAIMTAVFIIATFVAFLFADFGVNTTVITLPSPDGAYTASVIDSDQGALGGDTLVDIRQNKKPVSLLIGEFKKAPVRVYTGEWGEYEDMQISWADERTLIIDDREYRAY